MTRPLPLERLREISRQRTFRTPILVPLPIEGVEDIDDAPRTKVEWPVPN
jgi:hypothetical protein